VCARVFFRSAGLKIDGGRQRRLVEKGKKSRGMAVPHCLAARTDIACSGNAESNRAGHPRDERRQLVSSSSNQYNRRVSWTIQRTAGRQPTIPSDRASQPKKKGEHSDDRRSSKMEPNMSPAQTRKSRLLTSKSRKKIISSSGGREMDRGGRDASSHLGGLIRWVAAAVALPCAVRLAVDGAGAGFDSGVDGSRCRRRRRCPAN
jgi:hypothetical protein